MTPSPSIRRTRLGSAFMGRRWPAVACSSHGRRGEHAQALALPNRQESKPVVFDLIGPPGPGRHDAADRRQAGLDEIGRIERHAGTIASALEGCESVFTRHGRSAANWNARSRNRGSRMLFTVQNCESMLRATALGRMQNLHLRGLLPGHGTQPDACCVPFCDLDGAAQIWPPSRVHSVRSAGGVGPGSDLRSRSHQHEWRFSTRAASVHRTGL